MMGRVNWRAATLGVLLAASVCAPTALAAKPKPRPAVLSLTASPASLPAGGGSVVLTARVAHAARCTFRGQRRAGAAMVVLRTVSCAAGRARIGVPVAASRIQQVDALRFSVTATGGGRTASIGTRILQAAYAPPPPLQITSSTTLPIAAVGGAYTAALTATGGASAGFQWSVVAGSLPAGLALSADGTISGTPTAAGTASFTVQVEDASHLPAQAQLSMIVTDAPPPTAPFGEAQSRNWSGYFATGGPFTSVSGTFNVPTISAAATDADTSEWVGIDGANNESLIQAGVEEFYSHSQNQIQVRAWWEILPDFEKFVPITVSPGDQVTIAIGEQSNGSWLIQIDDSTNGQRWQTTQSYSGPLTSVEWIVEAPTNGVSGQIEALGVYSPPVTFTTLGETGTVTGLDEVVMVDTQGGPVSTPSPFGPTGFTVAYGGGTPAPPP